ncbi:unnamed protein product [Penicillium camemberti]|uniref:Str. FM013 n=1 Tax=Penicillium camemberti (strain FM 013) TaxID=1429867 RepID=A0A0G4PJC1_PENC3|nr:unnamed protein product [Penicillium camemberti]
MMRSELVSAQHRKASTSAGYLVHTFQSSSLLFSSDSSTWTATRTERPTIWFDAEDRLNHIPMQKKEKKNPGVCTLCTCTREDTITIHR